MDTKHWRDSFVWKYTWGKEEVTWRYTQYKGKPTPPLYVLSELIFLRQGASHTPSFDGGECLTAGEELSIWVSRWKNLFLISFPHTHTFLSKTFTIGGKTWLLILGWIPMIWLTTSKLPVSRKSLFTTYQYHGVSRALNYKVSPLYPIQNTTNPQNLSETGSTMRQKFQVIVILCDLLTLSKPTMSKFERQWPMEWTAFFACVPDFYIFTFFQGWRL